MPANIVEPASARLRDKRHREQPPGPAQPLLGAGMATAPERSRLPRELRPLRSVQAQVKPSCPAVNPAPRPVRGIWLRPEVPEERGGGVDEVHPSAGGRPARYVL